MVAACNLIATDHGRYGLVSNAECLVDVYLCIIGGGNEKLGGRHMPPKSFIRGVSALTKSYSGRRIQIVSHNTSSLHVLRYTT